MRETDRELLTTLHRLAPGTSLRQAFGRIIQQGNGALVVLGRDQLVDHVCSGGFELEDSPFTAPRLAELAKMDGAIVLSNDCESIIRANVHLIPDSTMPTDETGSRHRTAERTARQTGKPVISISEDRAVATLFIGDEKHELESPQALAGRVNQALQTIERFRRRLDDAEERMTRLEVADLMTYRSVVLVLQRAELINRISDQVSRDSVGLGPEGNLVRLQLADLLQGTDELRTLVVRDYVDRLTKKSVNDALDTLGALSTEELQDLSMVAAGMGFEHPDAQASPRGLRLLSQVPRLPETVREEVAKHFKDFRKLLYATVEELDDVPGVGRTRALQLRRFLDRMTDHHGLLDLLED